MLHAWGFQDAAAAPHLNPRCRFPVQRCRGRQPPPRRSHRSFRRVRSGHQRRLLQRARQGSGTVASAGSLLLCKFSAMFQVCARRGGPRRATRHGPARRVGCPRRHSLPQRLLPLSLTGDAVGRAGAHQAAGKLVQVGLAQEHAACHGHTAKQADSLSEAAASCSRGKHAAGWEQVPVLLQASSCPLSALSQEQTAEARRRQQRRAPASNSGCTARACAAGVYWKAGQAAVVGCPATSMLSFTAKGMPHRGPRCSGGRLSRNLWEGVASEDAWKRRTQLRAADPSRPRSGRMLCGQQVAGVTCSAPAPLRLRAER